LKKKVEARIGGNPITKETSPREHQKGKGKGGEKLIKP